MANKVSRWEKGLCTSNDQAWLIGLVSRCTRVVQLAYLVASRCTRVVGAVSISGCKRVVSRDTRGQSDADYCSTWRSVRPDVLTQGNRHEARHCLVHTPSLLKTTKGKEGRLEDEEEG